MVRVLPILPRWLLAGLLAGALLLPGTLAGGQERALEVALGSEPATLDPFLATDANGVRISHQLIFETLVRLGGDLEIVPGLATWDRISPKR